MSINYPASLDSLTNPLPTDSRATVSLAGKIGDLNDAVEALEAKVGIDGSAYSNSLDYKVSQKASGPASSTDNAIVRFDGTGGKTVQNSGVIVDDMDNVSVPGEVTITDGDGSVAVRKHILHVTPTGVHDGCVLAPVTPGSTTFTISSGVVQRADPTTHPHTYEEFSFPGGTFTNNFLSSTFTYVLIGTDGVVYQQDTKPTMQAFTEKAYVGVIANSGGVQVASSSRALSTSSLGNQIQEYLRLVGPINVDGNIKASANGANTSINTSAGNIWRVGANYANSIAYPNNIAITAKNPLSFVQYYVNGSGVAVAGSLTTTMDTSNYNNAGTLATVATNKWVNHRLYMSPNGNGLMLYGSVLYNSLADAKAGRATETFNVPGIIADQAKIAWVTVKGQTTDLSNTTNNDIFSVESFTSGGGGGGTGSGDMLASVYDPAGIAQQVVGLTATQTLSNKTINTAKGADIASATTTDIGAATGNYVNITGTTTITGLGTVQAGTQRVVNFTGALTLTYNATSLILPTGASITTAAGDTATFVSLGSGNWICTQYQRATGKAVSESVSASNTVTFTNKRVTLRTGSTTSSATPTINTDNVDMYLLTAQAADITSFTTNLSGTPTEGQKLWISITGTAARAITWGTSFEASTVALPTTTVTTNRLDVGFVWNTTTSKWRCVAVA